MTPILVAASEHEKIGSSEETSQGWDNALHVTNSQITLSGERSAADTVVNTSIIPGATASTQQTVEPGGDSETLLHPSNMEGLAFENTSVWKSPELPPEEEGNFERWLERDAVGAETPIANGDVLEGARCGETLGTCEEQNSPNHRTIMLSTSRDETPHHAAEAVRLSPPDADNQGYNSSIEDLQDTARPETIHKCGESGLASGMGASRNVGSFQSSGSSINFKPGQLRNYLGANESFTPTQRETLNRTGECASCHILHEALLKALSLCQQRPVPQPWSSTIHQRPSTKRKPRDRYLLRRRTTTANGYCEVSSDDESILGSATRDTGRAGSVNSVAHEKDSRSPRDRRRRWTQLEERRIRSWKLENKPDAWIAAKLDRTVSAVRQQWRKMDQA